MRNEIDLYIPSDPDLKDLIIKALLMRIAKLHPVWAAICKKEIHGLFGIESAVGIDPRLIYKHQQKTLERISNGSIDRTLHTPSMLKFQREFLGFLFDKGKYPVKVRNESTQKEWVKKHKTDLWRALTDIPCRCNPYPSEDEWFKNIMHRWNDLPARYRRSEVILLMIGSLHRIESLPQIQKLIKKHE